MGMYDSWSQPNQYNRQPYNGYGQIMGGGAPSGFPGPLGNMMQILQQFTEFCSKFQGDPQKKVQELLKSGQMTKEQYKQLETVVKQLLPYIKPYLK